MLNNKVKTTSASAILSQDAPKPKPKEYDVPHDKWRDGQYEAVQWMLNGDGVKILEAETGSGKSGMATAVTSRKQTMALCKTKLLQEANYKNIYSWDELFGKANYDCAHPDVNNGARADQCLHTKNMHKCPVIDSCKYHIKKTAARSSHKTSLNYAYYLMAGWPRREPFDYLFMDEAHLLSDITLDYAGVQINENVRREWELEKFPVFAQESVSLLFSVDQTETNVGKAIQWLSDNLILLNRRWQVLEPQARHDDDARQKLRRCQNLIRKFEATVNSLNSDDQGWFIRSGSKLISYRGQQIPGIIIRPLTARHHFPRLFLNNETSVLMSATIGDPKTFADELGIKESEFRYVPSRWKPEVRPIRVLDAPRMNRKSTDEDYEEQADVIAEAILKCPPSWSGVIHVTRIAEAGLLMARLAKRGLYNRVWKPPLAGTNIQMSAWEQHKKRTNGKGPIAISWSWTEGVDLFDERICISAKVPYPPLGDLFERERMEANRKFYTQRTAYSFMQSLGRTRRGDPGHYDLNGEVNGFVGIADGNWTRIKSHFGNDFMESIIYE